MSSSRAVRVFRLLRLLLATILIAGAACARYRGSVSAASGDVARRSAQQGAEQGPGKAGVLTAGIWDDNANFDFYLRYLAELERAQPPGLVVIPRRDRLTITVTAADGRPLAGADVRVAVAGAAAGGDAPAFASVTGGDGRVLYFPAWAGARGQDSLEITASRGAARVRAAAHAGDAKVTLALPVDDARPPAALDVMFVVDTTGSMGDEIRYLQAELEELAGAVAGRFPSLRARWSLVAYRDEGDEYVVRPYDFVADPAAFERTLAAQSADGGGDYPEAPDQALAAAVEQSWQSGATARVLFWLADAPHHRGREQAMAAAYARAVSRGIHIYPVAASGADDVTEHAMRTAAEVTGGRFLFLTDDSGVGLAHQEPHIPCYRVATFAATMRRALEAELAGHPVEPPDGEVIRTVGDPQDRRCHLTGGRTMTAW
jgi:hypothetical protein